MSNKCLKIFTILLVLIMICTLFAACNDDSDDNVDDGITKICLLINGNLGDKSFFDSANEGIKRIKAEFPDIVTHVKEVGLTASNWESSLREVCNSKENYDLIIVGTEQMRERLQRIATAFPNKKFIIFDADITKDAKGKTYPNVYSIKYKQNEGSFLAGALISQMLQTIQPAKPMSGFVGGQKVDIIMDFAAGYYQGIKHINETYSLTPIKTYVNYVGGFTDSTTGKSMASAMYKSANAPAGIIFQAASQSGLGCIDAAKEAGKFIVGVDSDQYEYFVATDKEKAECIVTSVLKRVDLSLYKAIKEFLDDNLQFGTVVSLGLADKVDGQQVIGLAKNAYYQQVVSLNIRNIIDEIESKIIAGDIIVGSAYDMTVSEFNALEDSVK